MEVHDSNDFILLNSRAYSDVIEFLGKNVLSMSSVRDSVVNDQVHHSLKCMVSPINPKL